MAFNFNTTNCSSSIIIFTHRFSKPFSSPILSINPFSKNLRLSFRCKSLISVSQTQNSVMVPPPPPPPSNSLTASTDQALVEEHSSVRTIILNRPKQLNALSSQMVSSLLELFLAYEEDCRVKLIIMKGKGKAFCAGGDIVGVLNDIGKENWRTGADYFSKDFTLKYLMATYSKPQVSILNGIVMGGGAGASIHGRFRVATENSQTVYAIFDAIFIMGHPETVSPCFSREVFAMPETALGLFPDVGASFYLSRLPGFFGEYAGLTGARLDGAELLVFGLATHYVPSEKLPLLEDRLLKVDSGDQTIIGNIISEFSQVPKLKEKSPYYRLATIDKCFCRRTVEEIISALENEASNGMDDWLSWTIKSLKTASPTSLKISLRSIREGRFQGVGQCLVREYRMVCNVMRGIMSKDFFEGCRALLVDKDKNPKWEPSSLELISNDMVERYFSPVEDEDWTDLKLPARSNLPAYAIAKL